MHAIFIFRLLDGKTLLTAALVCRKWMRIIKSDRVLRKKIRDEFRARRMAGMFYRPATQLSDASATFSNMSNLSADNVRRVTKTLGVEPRTGLTQAKKRKFETCVSVCAPQKKAKTVHAKNDFATSKKLQRLR